MPQRTSAATLLGMTTALLAATVLLASAVGPRTSVDDDNPGPRNGRVVGTTMIVGDVNQALWERALDTLPVRPSRIVILDVKSLSSAWQQKVRRLDAFVVDGSATVFILRQASTLRQAEFGEAFDRLVLASLVFHEMAHARGLDEGAALEAEKQLWRAFVGARRADPALGMSYVQRLEEERRRIANVTSRAAESMANSSEALLSRFPVGLDGVPVVGYEP